MPTIDEYASQPREVRMHRLSRTADELAAAVAGQEEGAAFRRRRAETLETFRRLTPSQWEKAAVHPALGRITIDRVLSIMAFHDDNHLDRLERALRGRP